MGRREKVSDCLFCKIAAGEIPAKLVHEDEQAVAFADIHPQAPTHVLVIPRKHIDSLAAVDESDLPVVAHLHKVAAEVARKAGLRRGFRVVINTGADGGQTVGHLHLHLLGGRAMHWPPG
jgi:histidine triad (HIT) family protein